MDLQMFCSAAVLGDGLFQPCYDCFLIISQQNAIENRKTIENDAYPKLMRYAILT